MTKRLVGLSLGLWVLAIGIVAARVASESLFPPAELASVDPERDLRDAVADGVSLPGAPKLALFTPLAATAGPDYAR